MDLTTTSLQVLCLGFFQKESDFPKDANDGNYVICIGSKPQTTFQMTNGERKDLKKLVMPEGPRGEPGKPGDKLNFSDLSDEDKRQIMIQVIEYLEPNMPKPKDGDKGDKMTYADLTDKEKLSLIDSITSYAIPKLVDMISMRIVGEVVEKLIPSCPRGEPGKSLTFDDLTKDQKESLEGRPGSTGEKMKFSDLTDKEKKELKEEMLSELKKIIPAPIQGAPGKNMKFSDLTDQQKEELKGDPGKNMNFSDLSQDDKTKLVEEIGTYVLSKRNK